MQGTGTRPTLSPARAAPLCGCFCGSYKMIACRGRGSWPSPREAGAELTAASLSFSPRPPGERLGQEGGGAGSSCAPGPAGQGAGKQEAALGSWGGGWVDI